MLNPGRQKNLKKGEYEEKKQPASEIAEERFYRDLRKNQKSYEETRGKEKPCFFGLKKRESKNQDGRKLAPGIPTVQERTSWNIMKGYSLSHETFSLPRRA